MLLEKAKDLSWEQEVKKTNQAQEIIKQNQPLEVKEFQFLVESWKEMVPWRRVMIQALANITSTKV